MSVDLIDSKKQQLQPQDILYIAAHNDDEGLKVVKEKMNAEGVSPERMLYAIYLQEMQNPSLIRLNEGNTLYVIIPQEGEIGVMTSYNADTEEQYKKNTAITFSAARNMGFKYIAFLDPTLAEVAKQYPDSSFGAKNGINVLSFGE
jgi:hypothetical protein